MTDPQPHHLKQKPQRAEPWQPDQPGTDVEQDDAADTQTSPTRSVRNDSPQDTSAAVSSEAAIPRDPQTGQALNDPSLKSGKDSEQSNGRSGSMHLPES